MKLKVLFILHIPPPIHGAAMVGKLIQESHLINNTFNTAYINLSTSSNMNEVGKGGMKKIFETITLITKVSNALISKRYDLCYMTLTAKGYGYYKDLIIVTILKLFQKKIIYHFHNKGVAAQHHKMLSNLLYAFTFKKTKSILLSKLLYPDIAQYVKKEDVFYCPNGIPVLKTNIKEIQKPNDCVRLLFLSNMIVEKGVLVLLEACKILKDKNIIFECNFVGAWTDISPEIFNMQVLKYDLKNFVFAHGPKYNSEKIDFLLSADIFVFPTFYHNECFPIVLLEAMQYYLPLISTNEGGIPDIIDNGVTGFIVPKNNAIELADKLELLIKNPLLRSQMAIAAEKRFTNEFTTKHFDNRFIEILGKAYD